jgi:hypothetical protein
MGYGVHVVIPRLAKCGGHITIEDNAAVYRLLRCDHLWLVLFDIRAVDAEAAIDAAWDAYKEHDWPLKTVDDVADADGWTSQKRFAYQTSPNERRFVSAGTMFANELWTVWIYDVANDVGGKRGAQINL